MPDDEYKWDDADCIIREVNATAIYINVNGDLVIRQQHPYQDDAFIIIPVEHADKVINALVAKKAEAGNLE